VGDLKNLLRKADELALHELETLYQHIQARRKELAHKHLKDRPHPDYPPGKALTPEQVDALFAEWTENAKHD
jgi:hypothetical protein